MKYRLTKYVSGEMIKRELDIKSLCKHSVRKTWRKIPGHSYQAQIVDAELNLAENNNKEREQWINVRLLLVRGKVDGEKTTIGKHDWAVSLATDTALSATDMLEFIG
jgi:hypothetical protein